MYVLVIKKGSKVYALCSVINATCNAHASSVAIAAGYPNEWKVKGVRMTGDYVFSQKNYAGKADGFSEVDCKNFPDL